MQVQPVTEWGNNFIQKFDLHAHSTILELGCRQGHLSSRLATQYPSQQIIAIDNKSSEIEKAQQYNIANLQFMQQDAMALPYIEEFDALVSFNCLLWVKDKYSVLKNMYHALKPGGKAYLQFFASHGRPKNDRFLSQTAASSPFQHYFKNFQYHYYEIDPSHFCRLLHNAGFIIHRFEFADHPTVFAHGEDLQQWFASWASQLAYLPASKQESFLAKAAQSYLDFHQFVPENEFTYHEYMLEVICEKPLQPHTSLYQYNGIEFSKREAQVLKQYLQGKSAKEIGVLFCLSAKTIEFHLAKIKEKLNCHKRSEIYARALQDGFMHSMFDDHL